MNERGAGLAVFRDHDGPRFCFFHELTELVLHFVEDILNLVEIGE